MNAQTAAALAKVRKDLCDLRRDFEDHRHNDQIRLRDQIAMAALAGVMSSSKVALRSVEWQRGAAWDAYSVADAMMKERVK